MSNRTQINSTVSSDGLWRVEATPTVLALIRTEDEEEKGEAELTSVSLMLGRDLSCSNGGVLTPSIIYIGTKPDKLP